jgi:Ca2+-binding EF-hand superfamily protein
MQLENYLTERECQLLLNRLGPNKTGAIAYEHFV